MRPAQAAGAAELEFPFARELEEQHDALRVAARWFQSAVLVEQARADGRALAREFLLLLREQLLRHFLYEEQSGFEGGFGSDDPEVVRWAHELVRQHRAFERRLGALLAGLGHPRALLEATDPWLEELRAFLRDLRRHDAEESALMLWIARGPLDFARELEPG